MTPRYKRAGVSRAPHPIILEASMKVLHPSPSASSLDSLRVVNHPEGWALMVEDIKVPAWVVSTRAKAVRAAHRAARDLRAKLTVHGPKGLVIETIDCRAS